MILDLELTREIMWKKNTYKIEKEKKIGMHYLGRNKQKSFS